VEGLLVLVVQGTADTATPYNQALQVRDEGKGMLHGRRGGLGYPCCNRRPPLTAHNLSPPPERQPSSDSTHHMPPLGIHVGLRVCCSSRQSGQDGCWLLLRTRDTLC